MKQWLPVLVIALGAWCSVSTATSVPGELLSDVAYSQLAQKLNLTAEQEALVKPILEEALRKQAGLQSEDLNRRLKQRKLKAQAEITVKMLEDVLTPEQVTSFKQYRKETKDKWL